jgi:LCP family protein required for cell wall assembly
MDKFRRYRPEQGRRQSTDGFVSSREGGGRQPASLNRVGSYQPVNTRRVGDFRAADGFQPTRPASRGTNPLFEQKSTEHEKAPRSHHPRTASLAWKKAEKKRGRLSRLNPFSRANWSKKRALKTAAAFMVLTMLVGGYFGGKAYLKAKQIFRGGGEAAALEEGVDPSKLRGEGDGRVNILLLGRGGEGHEGADLTDTILVASIDPVNKEAALLSIPRDLYVKPTSGGYTKINAVFANAKNSSLANTSQKDSSRDQKATDAGFKAVEEVIQSKIGIPVHYHAMVDFEGFKKAIDTVGGVDANVAEANTVTEVMYLDGRNYKLDVGTGPQHFDGTRALAFSRSRHTSARGDFDRSERQRLIMVALKNKIMSAGTYSNPLKVNQLMSDFGNHIQTNLSTGEVMRLYQIGQGLDSSKIASVGLADPPNNYVTTDMINGQSVVVPRAGTDNFKEIQSFVRNRLRDSYLAQENASVAVFNGTGVTGLATRTADELKSYGYNVVSIADAPTSNYQNTTVIDLRSGAKKYTKSYLEKRFSSTAAGSLPDQNINPGTADFVIILGQNEQARLGNQ